MTRLTFADGDRLFAADVQAIQDQSVIVFADATERDADWATPPEGALCYLVDPGEYQTYDGADWSTFASGGATTLDGLSDVDTTGKADGDALTWDSGAGLWVPAAPAAGALTHSYLGYNTVGASYETITANRVYMKKITTAGAGLISKIGAYLGAGGDNAQSIAVALMADNAGAPGDLMGLGPRISSGLLLTGSGPTVHPTWIDLPIGVWAPAGSYWLAVQLNGTNLRLYYDTGGSDRYYTSGGTWMAHGGRYSETDSTFRYSIRAGLLA